MTGRARAIGVIVAAAGSCGEPGERAHAIRFRTSDGVSLAGAVVGSGRSGRC
jgi:hypothetical protein